MAQMRPLAYTIPYSATTAGYGGGSAQAWIMREAQHFGGDLPSKRFERRVEDFTCRHCGAAVKGDGYTNHCPHCLWSRHVDVNPGDRAADCGGMMRPVALEQKAGRFTILHRCEACGHERKNKAREEDNLFALYE